MFKKTVGFPQEAGKFGAGLLDRGLLDRGFDKEKEAR
jgi:hypothetical protein